MRKWKRAVILSEMFWIVIRVKGKKPCFIINIVLFISIETLTHKIKTIVKSQVFCSIKYNILEHNLNKKLSQNHRILVFLILPTK